MRRKNTREMEEAEGLNLAPIMNLVMILIPLLLLSVVFEQMGVINISAPSAVGPITTTPTDPPPLSLTIGISALGFQLTAEKGERVAPIEGCPEQGATVCNKARTGDVVASLAEMERLRERYDVTGERSLLVRSDQMLEDAMASYDFKALYNSLVQIKRRFPKETLVTVSASPEVPFEILVATMDTARYRLEGEREDGTFDQEAAFKSARYKETVTGYSELFSDVRLAVVQ